MQHLTIPFRLCSISLFAVLLVFMLSVPAQATILYQQPFDNIGSVYSSQNNTASSGNFNAVFDDFTLGSAATVTEVKWTGAYFNPPNQGPITKWTISFYADNAGQPGSLLLSDSVSSTGNETFLGNFAGFPAYTYDIDGSLLTFAASTNTRYWLSVVPDLASPPQWGWARGIGGDGILYQDISGTRSQLAVDMAFTLSGNAQTAVPEPASLLLLGTGLSAVGLAARRRKRA